MNDEILNSLQQYLWKNVQLYMLANKEKLCDIRFDAFVDVKNISIGDKADYMADYMDEFREQQGGGLYLYGDNKIRNHCTAKQDS